MVSIAVRYQPLLVYLLMGLTCFWLIILTLADEKQFLSTDSLPSVEFLKTECNRTKYENNTNGQQFLTSFSSPSPAECLLDPSDPKLVRDQVQQYDYVFGGRGFVGVVNSIYILKCELLDGMQWQWYFDGMACK